MENIEIITLILSCITVITVLLFQNYCLHGFSPPLCDYGMDLIRGKMRLLPELLTRLVKNEPVVFGLCSKFSLSDTLEPRAC